MGALLAVLVGAVGGAALVMVVDNFPLAIALCMLWGLASGWTIAALGF